MKAFFKTCLLSSSAILILIGCGEMHTNQPTARDVFLQMHKDGEISDEHLAYLQRNVNPELLDQSVEITRTSDTSLVMNFGDRSTAIDIEKGSGDNSPISTLSVNGQKLNLKSSRSEREKERSILEGILGLLSPNERDDIEEGLGLNLGDLIDLGYSEDRDEAELILLGTLIIRALRNFRNENPDKPFVALYAFGNSAEAILSHKSAAANDMEKNDGINIGRVLNGAGLIYSFFDPLVGTIIRVLGALAS